MELEHINFRLIPCGLIISLKNPMIGASSDALIRCDCCGEGCVEVKCPFRLKDTTIDFKDLLNLKNSFLQVNEDRKIVVNPNHEYYYQIQLQMYCAETQYCDFVVWFKKRTVVLRTDLNMDFVSKNIVKAKIFHKNIIVPELLARYYTSPKENVFLVSEYRENNLE